jgi:hypothetical protein
MAEIGPFSRPVQVDSIPKDGLQQTIEASEAERDALAKLTGLEAVRGLTGEFMLIRGGRGTIEVRGEVRAEVTQTCIVSLDPFDVALEETVDVRFAPPAGEHTARRRSSSPPEKADPAMESEDDPPDPIVDGKIDLGALAVEFMILGLDPYPRKPGVDFADRSPETDGTKTG